MLPIQLIAENIASRPAAKTLRGLLKIARAHQRTLVMGVLNVTPDSFSDGGLFFDPRDAEAHAHRLAEEGADILDIGGESTRPATFAKNAPLDVGEEMRRVLPVIERISRSLPRLPISIDTYKSEVAHLAVVAGAVMVNDISAGRADPAMLSTVAELGVPICLMHLLGLPTAIPLTPHYQDVVREVREHLQERVQAALSAGIREENILIDPGLGFGKTVEHNLELMRRLRELVDPRYLLLVGPSRKATIGKVLGDLPPEDRLEGTAATVALSIAGGAAIVRVHDVRQMARVMRMSDAILYGLESAQRNEVS